MDKSIEKKEIERLIDKKRGDLNALLKRKNNVIDDEVVNESQELDKLLNIYDKFNSDYLN